MISKQELIEIINSLKIKFNPDILDKLTKRVEKMTNSEYLEILTKENIKTSSDAEKRIENMVLTMEKTKLQRQEGEYEERITQDDILNDIFQRARKLNNRNVKEIGYFVYHELCLHFKENTESFFEERRKRVAHYDDLLSDDYSGICKNMAEVYADIMRMLGHEVKLVVRDPIISDFPHVDAILFDFGVSSMQLDNADRGFSFMQNAELDMRMSQNDEMSAADFINTYSEDDISKVLYFYGDERQSKAIAKEICRIRKIHKIQNTTELCNIIYNVKGKKKEGNINAATKVFQAIRMFVNNELLEIEHALKKLPYILKYNARIATITFHSTEDRVVKYWQKQNRLHFQKINKHVILPSHEEVYNNIRSRSAKLRGFVYA